MSIITRWFWILGLEVIVLTGRTFAADMPADAPSDPAYPLRLPNVPLHDPWILAQADSKTYYLYTGGRTNVTGTNRSGTVTYTSKNLRDWEGPHFVFVIPDGMWADPAQGAWAPEVHAYRGKYYLFTTLHNPTKPLPALGVPARPNFMRSTMIAVSDSPEGPFTLLKKDAPVAPPANPPPR